MVVALDLFAGHGWGVACRELGIEEYGVEIMPEACAVREANGMRTIYNDVWHGLVEGRGLRAGQPAEWYDLLIASPPCQTFSMAGSGAGRKALDEVLAAIDARLYLDPAALVAFGETHDPKTALVLAPLAHIARDTPTFVVLEQVPPVLPVWERYAEEMRRWGYSVWTGNLQAEMYGVPQTRKRAILIARADGKEAKAPTPTHSRYYSRDPQRLDEGVLPWVSMAEALGWGMTERPMVTAGNAIGRAEGVGGSGAKAAIEREKELPAPTVTSGARSAKIMRSNYGTSGDPEARGERADGQPAPTVTSKAGRNHWVHGEHGESINLDPGRPATTVAGDPRLSSREHHYHGEQNSTSTRVTVAEAAALQSYPADFIWDVNVTKERFVRVWDRKPDPDDIDDEGEWHMESRGISTAPITKTNMFLQIGNAVPPRLAEAILREVLS